nr:transposase [Rhodoferax aquaticus]
MDLYTRINTATVSVWSHLYLAHTWQAIHTTNALESVNASLCKTINSREHFSSEDAASQLILLALRNITGDWSRTNRD